MAAIVTFDPVALIIEEINTGSPAVNALDVLEVYGEWKDWLIADASRLGAPLAFRVVGGDPISGVQSLGSTFFLSGGWKIRPAEYSHKLVLVGNLFTDPAGESAIIPTTGNYTVLVEMSVSNLIDTMTVGGVDQATVQAAMTAQGYTTGRAPRLDDLLSIYQRLGLDPTQPLVVNKNDGTRKVPSNGSIITQTLVESPAGVVTTTRTV